jgi:hypothetical protein
LPTIVKAAVVKLVTGSQELKTIIDKEKDSNYEKSFCLYDTFHEIIGLACIPKAKSTS